MRVGSRAERPTGASMTPVAGSGWPQASASYRRSTERDESCATSDVYAAGERATMSSPDVPLSSRCTMPGRAGSPTSAISGNRATSPCTSVPEVLPAPGCTTRPAGLSTTSTSPSSCTTSSSTVGSPCTPIGSGSGTSTVSEAPSATRVFAERSTRPSSSTAPPSTSAAATARLTPVTVATTRSSRSPASAAGTATVVTGDRRSGASACSRHRPRRGGCHRSRRTRPPR